MVLYSTAKGPIREPIRCMLPENTFLWGVKRTSFLYSKISKQGFNRDKCTCTKDPGFVSSLLCNLCWGNLFGLKRETEPGLEATDHQNRVLSLPTFPTWRQRFRHIYRWGTDRMKALKQKRPRLIDQARALCLMLSLTKIELKIFCRKTIFGFFSFEDGSRLKGMRISNKYSRDLKMPLLMKSDWS